MRITINGVNADIQTENEKTVGEVLAGLESWLAGSGHRLSGFSVDGEAAVIDSMEDSFAREINGIQAIDIITSSLTDLIAESLEFLLQDIEAWETVKETAGFDEKAVFAERWKETPEAVLLAEQMPEVYDWTVKTFSGEGALGAELRLIAEERLRELRDPAGEMGRLESAVIQVCERLQQLPLDVQTGKDSEAAGTISFFTSIGEKVFRIFRVLGTEGFFKEEITVADTPISVCLAAFGKSLTEMLEAYKQKDTVLIGDLAEYEMAPALKNIYSAICEAAGIGLENKIGM